mmetsp:Transcript_6832/g.21197  ORF Transcript_6832/g.21197 Transcript_6832/m.21197 type:complete len:95 (-) Transcript_6832:248-532(-)
MLGLPTADDNIANGEWAHIKSKVNDSLSPTGEEVCTWHLALSDWELGAAFPPRPWRILPLCSHEERPTPQAVAASLVSSSFCGKWSPVPPLEWW